MDHSTAEREREEIKIGCSSGTSLGRERVRFELNGFCKLQWDRYREKGTTLKRETDRGEEEMPP